MTPALCWRHYGCWVLLLILHDSSRGVAHPPPTPTPGPAHCRGCPYFLNTPIHITTAVGDAANLTCGVRMLGDRQVSWIRRRDLHVLTTDSFTYTTDSRFRAIHVKTSPYWVLSINEPDVSDSGVYECQVSAQPKIFKRFTLDVVVPRATIVGSAAVFMKAGSDLNITCLITGATAQAAPVTWYHVNPTLKSSSTVLEELNSGGRGGVQLVTDRRAGTSWLLVTNATWRDAGNYTCSPEHADPASVSVHVLDEESPAAMQPHLQANTSPPPSSASSSSSSSSSSSASASSASSPSFSSQPSRSQLCCTHTLTLTLVFLLRLFFKIIYFPRGSAPLAGWDALTYLL
ncbi:hemicentin-1-like [Panulirus ornatus]|uniref:hemicentin-1-like n=1 Tax=Panulirus ornatus TaxID=150431 RepID=UPI003A8A485E